MHPSPKHETINSQTTANRPLMEDRRRSVLIADDDADTRLMLRTVLELNSFKVLEAADGEAAVQLVEKERPDVVLMDFSLPVIDGLAALRRIRASTTTPEVPIIFLSGRAEPAPQMAAREAGCNDYLVKPVDLDRVVRLVEGCLVNSSAN